MMCLPEARVTPGERSAKSGKSGFQADATANQIDQLSTNSQNSELKPFHVFSCIIQCQPMFFFLFLHTIALLLCLYCSELTTLYFASQSSACRLKFAQNVAVQPRKAPGTQEPGWLHALQPFCTERPVGYDLFCCKVVREFMQHSITTKLSSCVQKRVGHNCCNNLIWKHI